MYKSNSNFGAGCPSWADWADLRFGFVHSTDIVEQNQNMFCVWDITGIPCIVPSTVPEKCGVMQNSTMQGV